MMSSFEAGYSKNWATRYFVGGLQIESKFDILSVEHQLTLCCIDMVQGFFELRVLVHQMN